MKFKFKAQVASINGTEYPKFTDENLREMAKSAPEIPILLDFNQEKIIGKCRFAGISDGFLVVNGVLNIKPCRGYMTVGGRIHEDGNIHKIELTCLGHTDNPTDKTLSPLEWTDD